MTWKARGGGYFIQSCGQKCLGQGTWMGADVQLGKVSGFAPESVTVILLVGHGGQQQLGATEWQGRLANSLGPCKRKRAHERNTAWKEFLCEMLTEEQELSLIRKAQPSQGCTLDVCFQGRKGKGERGFV